MYDDDVAVSEGDDGDASDRERDDSDATDDDAANEPRGE